MGTSYGRTDEQRHLDAAELVVSGPRLPMDEKETM